MKRPRKKFAPSTYATIEDRRVVPQDAGSREGEGQ